MTPIFRFSILHSTGVGVLVIVLFLFLLAPTGHAQSARDLNKAIESQQAAVNKTRADQDAARTALKAVEDRLDKAQQAIDQLQDSIGKTDQALSQLKQQKLALTQQEATLKSRVRQGLRAAYRLGDSAAVRTMLARSDALETERDLHYLRDLLQPTLKAIAALKQTRANLAENQKKLDQTKASLNDDHDKLDAQLADWQEQKARQSKLIAQLNDQLNDQSAQLKELQQQKEALDAQVAAANRRAQQERARAPEKKQPAPVDTVADQGDDRSAIPVNGREVRQFGESLGLGGLRSQGIVFSAPLNQPVRAVAGGEVVYADHLKGWGNLVILRHPHNYLSLYAHNRSLEVHTGERVRAGQILGYTGQIDAQQTGMYFEVRHGNDTINPSHWKPWRVARRSK